MTQVTELAAQVGVGQACAALGVSRSSYYRFVKPKTTAVTAAEPVAHAPHPRALTAEEQAMVRETVNSERFADATPRTIYYQLLAEGRVLCHWRTMYRLLQAEDASHERRRVRSHTVYAKPELLATAPNQVWSWDITLLRGPQRGIWYRLYLVLDMFSRKVVGWLVATHETAEQAEHLLTDAYDREGVDAHQLTIHADRGAVMTSQLVAELLLD
jgi:putative transposase